MTRRRPSPYGRAITLERYNELDLTRPLTDLPTGTYTASRRRNDARHSRLIAAHGPPPRPRHRQEAVV